MALASNLMVTAADDLMQLVSHLNGCNSITPFDAIALLLVSKPLPHMSKVQGPIAAAAERVAGRRRWRTTCSFKQPLDPIKIHIRDSGPLD